MADHGIDISSFVAIPVIGFIIMTIIVCAVFIRILKARQRTFWNVQTPIATARPPQQMYSAYSYAARPGENRPPDIPYVTNSNYSTVPVTTQAALPNPNPINYGITVHSSNGLSNSNQPYPSFSYPQQYPSYGQPYQQPYPQPYPPSDYTNPQPPSDILPAYKPFDESSLVPLSNPPTQSHFKYQNENININPIPMPMPDPSNCNNGPSQPVISANSSKASAPVFI